MLELPQEGRGTKDHPPINLETATGGAVSRFEIEENNPLSESVDVDLNKQMKPRPFADEETRSSQMFDCSHALYR